MLFGALNRLKRGNSVALAYNVLMQQAVKPTFLMIAAMVLAGCEGLTPRTSGTAVPTGSGWQACDAERPKVCTMIYDPVCAQRGDGSRADYASPCNACADVAVSAWHPDTCEA